MNEVLIALGGNLGDVEISFIRAQTLLSSDLIQMRMSRIYRTEPVYDKPGASIPAEPAPVYTNAVVRAFTFHSPESLLARLLDVEHALGRVRPAPECSPRPIDLDLLLYGNVVIHSDNPEALQLPHPRMHQRQFVLEPACDVAPDWIHPILNKTLRTLYDELI